MRTKQEIKKKIKEIEKEYSKLPHYDFFGGDNWAQEDKLLYVLNNALKKGEDWVEDKLDDMQNEYDGDFPEDESEKRKMDALDWLLGNIEEL